MGFTVYLWGLVCGNARFSDVSTRKSIRDGMVDDSFDRHDTLSINEVSLCIGGCEAETVLVTN